MEEHGALEQCTQGGERKFVPILIMEQYLYIQGLAAGSQSGVGANYICITKTPTVCLQSGLKNMGYIIIL